MPRDEARLLDILVAARQVAEYVAGRTLDEFRANNMLHDAVIRQLMIIGEAARSISPETRALHPSIPWRQVLATRNIMVHDYERVDLATIWGIATRDVPDLIVALSPIVPPEGTS